jgi:hypothetical protein
MFFRRIKRYLQQREDHLFLAFEVAHFVIDVTIVVHIFFKSTPTL